MNTRSRPRAEYRLHASKPNLIKKQMLKALSAQRAMTFMSKLFIFCVWIFYRCRRETMKLFRKRAQRPRREKKHCEQHSREFWQCAYIFCTHWVAELFTVSRCVCVMKNAFKNIKYHNSHIFKSGEKKTLTKHINKKREDINQSRRASVTHKPYIIRTYL